MIVQDHGKDCATFKTAAKFLADTVTLDMEGPASSVDEREEREKLAEGFKKAILRDYLKMLMEQYEYTYSDECVAENIEANEYEFTEKGEHFG